MIDPRVMPKAERDRVRRWLRGMRMVNELRDRSVNQLRVLPAAGSATRRSPAASASGQLTGRIRSKRG